MTKTTPIRIANISNDPNLDWVWIRDLLEGDYSVSGRPLEWHNFTTAPQNKLEQKLHSFARLMGGRRLAKAARQEPFDLIISHGPWSTAWTENMIGSAKLNAKHLAFSFNFTDLPTGIRKTLMQRSFNTVDAFAVFTDAEQQLYAELFNIDPSKLIRAPWGVAPPLSAVPARQIEGPYFAALGGEARDYGTLCETARLCPDTQFVAVARPHSFDGLSLPENLKVFTNLPHDEAWGIVWHSEANLIPLRSQNTPCGLVTLVGGMHLGKAQITTSAKGVSDYVTEGETGLMVPAQDAQAMAAAVQKLQSEPTHAASLGQKAKTFATANCSEAATVAFFKGVMERWFG